MARQAIGIGSTANDGTGDPLRTAFDKANDNFLELYMLQSDGTTVVAVPATNVGAAGDYAGKKAYNATHFYICTAAYDGSTAIWRRVAIASW